MMQFSPNFKLYKTKHNYEYAFQTEKYYLRALGDDPRKDIADIRVQFPNLASDINIPPFFPEEKFFSSVFRIASPDLQLWTHYDVSYLPLSIAVDTI
ncbi:hypothetical protein DPMN_189122 [Dreissena polymorpha]|uniref:Uncharacterized protein n=1 Tax=Dreissena polymorpha TaxID=45954 RepID=A0A9D4DUW3_DREPO|nr:hypothetical protein DPMN_189122 [Dreissena polymorpha]